MLGEHLATTPLAHGLSAAIVARHLVRGEAATLAAELYLEAASAARNTNQAQLAQRYYLRALSLFPQDDRRRLFAHEALEAIYRHLGRRRERRLHLSALRRLARRDGHAKWAAQAFIRTARLELDEGVLARGLPIAQRAADIARLAKNAPLEVEALTVLSEILRDLGDTQGPSPRASARSRSPRAGVSSRACTRRSCARRVSCSATSGASRRRCGITSTRWPSFGQSGRVEARRACSRRWRSRCSCSSGSRT
ncbi:MAG: hypothetical protein IPM79_28985 [Polyangiaceae bacterium]|nr:hypothetical protein [Polyangiaceae bacterium]